MSPGDSYLEAIEQVDFLANFLAVNKEPERDAGLYHSMYSTIAATVTYTLATLLDTPDISQGLAQCFFADLVNKNVPLEAIAKTLSLFPQLEEGGGKGVRLPLYNVAKMVRANFANLTNTEFAAQIGRYIPLKNTDSVAVNQERIDFAKKQATAYLQNLLDAAGKNFSPLSEPELSEAKGRYLTVKSQPVTQEQQAWLKYNLIQNSAALDSRALALNFADEHLFVLVDSGHLDQAIEYIRNSDAETRQHLSMRFRGHHNHTVLTLLKRFTPEQRAPLADEIAGLLLERLPQMRKSQLEHILSSEVIIHRSLGEKILELPLPLDVDVQCRALVRAQNPVYSKELFKCLLNRLAGKDQPYNGFLQQLISGILRGDLPLVATYVADQQANSIDPPRLYAPLFIANMLLKPDVMAILLNLQQIAPDDLVEVLKWSIAKDAKLVDAVLLHKNAGAIHRSDISLAISLAIEQRKPDVVIKLITGREVEANALSAALTWSINNKHPELADAALRHPGTIPNMALEVALSATAKSNFATIPLILKRNEASDLNINLLVKTLEQAFKNKADYKQVCLPLWKAIKQHNATSPIQLANVLVASHLQELFVLQERFKREISEYARTKNYSFRELLDLLKDPISDQCLEFVKDLFYKQTIVPNAEEIELEDLNQLPAKDSIIDKFALLLHYAITSKKAPSIDRIFAKAGPLMSGKILGDCLVLAAGRGLNICNQVSNHVSSCPNCAKIPPATIGKAFGTMVEKGLFAQASKWLPSLNSKVSADIMVSSYASALVTNHQLADAILSRTSIEHTKNYQQLGQIIDQLETTHAGEGIKLLHGTKVIEPAKQAHALTQILPHLSKQESVAAVVARWNMVWPNIPENQKRFALDLDRFSEVLSAKSAQFPSADLVEAAFNLSTKAPSHPSTIEPRSTPLTNKRRGETLESQAKSSRSDLTH